RASPTGAEDPDDPRRIGGIASSPLAPELLPQARDGGVPLLQPAAKLIGARGATAPIQRVPPPRRATPSRLPEPRLCGICLGAAADRAGGGGRQRKDAIRATASGDRPIIPSATAIEGGP